MRRSMPSRRLRGDFEPVRLPHAGDGRRTRSEQALYATQQ